VLVRDDWFQPGARTLFVRDGDWSTGARVPRSEVPGLVRLLGPRDVCLLQTLAQHRYLVTDDLQALFFPSRRTTQQRLKTLKDRQLVLRWHQLQPLFGRVRRMPSVFALTERGAAVLAQCLKVDPRPLIRQSWAAAEAAFHLQHDLEVNAFWVALAAASPAEAGLYHWLGDDTMSRTFRDLRIDLAPDGWARYLLPDSEVRFHLEWDRGTESARRFLEKAQGYAAYYAQHSDPSHLLIAAPNPNRERTLRGTVAKAGAEDRIWTTNVELLREHGPLGEVWQGVGRVGRRTRLAELPDRVSTEHRVPDCIAKPAWWLRRPGGSEGA
jgi:hypothetical protein